MFEGLRPESTGDHLTTREQRTLGRFQHLGLMRYKDLDAYYCLDCSFVINVKCASCGTWSENKRHDPMQRKDDVFLVEQPISVIKTDELYWTTVECRKCDFKFRVIVR